MTLPPLEPRPQEDDSRLAVPPVDSIHYGLMREPQGGHEHDTPVHRDRPVLRNGGTLTPDSNGNLGPVANNYYYHVADVSNSIDTIHTAPLGSLIALQFDGSAVDLIHNATTLVLLGAANYNDVPAGTTVAFISEGGGNWREVWRNPHSHDAHVNRARTAVWVPAQAITLNGATRSSIGSSLGITETIAFADGATQSCYYTALFPYGTVATTDTWWLHLYLTSDTANGANNSVRFIINARSIADGGDLTATNGTTNPGFLLVQPKATALNLLIRKATGAADLDGSAIAELNLVRLNIQRDGTHLDDTFVGTIHLIGMMFEYLGSD